MPGTRGFQEGRRCGERNAVPGVIALSNILILRDIS